MMRLAVISGSRADRGPLRVLYQALLDEFYTDWIDITHLQPSADSSNSCAKRTGQALLEVVCDLEQSKADMVLLFGDRYEILGAAVGTYVAGYPIAHLSGGDITEGSQDDCMRHSISKLAHLHFPDNVASGQRLIQMGESPDRVFVVGDPAIDRIVRARLFDKKDTFTAIGLKEVDRALLVCFHPNTLGDTMRELDALRAALWAIDTPLVIIGPNLDAGHQSIRIAFENMAANRAHTVYHSQVDDQLYISLLRWCDSIVGNSSAALHEAPTFGLPAVNIGDRQKGRIKAMSVIDCVPQKEKILEAIEWAYKHPESFNMEFCVNPYGDGHACEKIIHVLKTIKYPKELLRKVFHEVPRQ